MKRIANFIPSLSGGGAERVAVNLLHAFDRAKVTPILITGTASGPFANKIPNDVEVIDLKTPRMRQATRPLFQILEDQCRPLGLSPEPCQYRDITSCTKGITPTCHCRR